jgi:hypothetical protein
MYSIKYAKKNPTIHKYFQKLLKEVSINLVLMPNKDIKGKQSSRTIACLNRKKKKIPLE